MKFAFNIESPIWKFMGFMGDLICLNLLFIATSIPIITIGTSLTSLYAVLFKMKEKRDSYLVKEYFTEFIRNFKNSTIIWGMYLAFMTICCLNINLQLNLNAGNTKVLFIALGVAMFFISITVMYALAMQARFENSLQQTLAKSFLFSIMCFPYTLCMVTLVAICGAISIVNVTYILYAVMFWFVIGFASVGYLHSRLFLKAFKRFTFEESVELE